MQGGRRIILRVDNNTDLCFCVGMSAFRFAELVLGHGLDRWIYEATKPDLARGTDDSYEAFSTWQTQLYLQV